VGKNKKNKPDKSKRAIDEKSGGKEKGGDLTGGQRKPTRSNKTSIQKENRKACQGSSTGEGLAEKNQAAGWVSSVITIKSVLTMGNWAKGGGD